MFGANYSAMQSILSFRKLSVLCWMILASQLLISQQVEVDSLTTYESDPVVLTGTRSSVRRSRVPFSLTIVDRSTLEKSNEINVLPVLNNIVPGLFLNSRNPSGFGVGPESAGNISIRGISGTPNTRVLILIDGQPQFMGIFGHPISDAYTASDIERVEVIRGAASLLYGSNAVGGAINIITRKQAKEGLQVGGLIEYGSFDSFKMNARGSWMKDGVSVFASFNREQTSGVREVGKDDFSNSTGYIKLQVPINDQFKLTVDGNLVDATYNHPGPISSPVENDQRDYLRGRGAVSIENTFNNWDGALKLYYNFGDHEFSTGFESTDFTRGLTFYQNFSLFDNNLITIGVDYQDIGGEAQNEMLPPQASKGLNESLSTQEWSTYGVIQQRIGKRLSLQGGIRWTNHSLYGNALTPGAGFSWMPASRTVIKGAINRAFRSPAIVELYLFPPSNRLLNPEEIWNYELGINQEFFQGMLQVELTGYIMEGENLIQQVLIGTPPPRYVNTGSFSHKGIEFTANANPAKDLDLSLTYHYLRVEDDILFAPENQVNFNASYTFSPFQFGVNIKSLNNLVTSLDPLEKESVVLFDATVSSKLTSWMTLYAKGMNLTDSNYQLQSGFPMPGRNAYVGLKFSFD